MIVLSPHLDDAIFSCGALLAERDATVVTICAGIPEEDVPPHQFDVAAGFHSGAEAVMARRGEDRQAAESLWLDVVHCDELETMYGGPTASTEEATAAALADCERGEMVLGPLGLRHPDHVAVARAFRMVALERDLDAWIYEELPYALAWPDYLPGALMEAGCEVAPFVVGAAEQEKRDAVGCYASQIGGDFALDALFYEERFHRLNGSAEL